MASKYVIAVEDLSVEGAELPDEQLLAVRGGFLGESTCNQYSDHDLD